MIRNNNRLDLESYRCKVTLHILCHQFSKVQRLGLRRMAVLPFMLDSLN